jgi:RNA polymerase sigma factor (sigma-70 family)
VDEREWLAARFERTRPHLRAVAYRMLGSLSEADDAVQEAWLRLSRTGADTIENLEGWLTTVVGRVCLDALRSRRARREEPAGTWLPEPLVGAVDEGSPEHEVVVSESVGLALLVVLETLSPAERLAFVLHDMFAVPFEEIGEIVGRSPSAARQLASRARRRVQGAAPEPEPDLARQQKVVDAFLAASRAGDFDALLDVLDPDVVFRRDIGLGKRTPEPVVGSAAVAREVLARGAAFAPFAVPAVVNGAAGAVVRRRGRTVSVVGFTVARGRVVELNVIADPDKLRAVQVRD